MTTKTLIGLAVASCLVAHPVIGQELLPLPLDNREQQQQPECGLYLAASSNPRKQRSTNQADRWGMYAGKSFMANDAIGFPDVAINVHAFRAHNTEDPEEDDVEHEFLSLIAETLIENLWQPEIAGAGDEVDEDAGGSEAFIPGAGVLSDFNTKFSNANFDVRSSYQRVSVGEEPGKPSPARGANSPFYNLVLRATDDIQAGDEIILNYDMVYDSDDDDDESSTASVEIDDAGAVNPETTIVEEDFTRIDQTVDQLLEFFQKHDQSVDDNGKLQIYRFMTDDFLEAAVGPIKARLIEALLPAHPNDLANVKKAGGIKKYSQMEQKEGVRSKSLEWLDQNGLCMDNIRSGPSTIPNAGRGAFANRNILKGGLVAPTPLYIIPDKVSMDMYQLVDDEEGLVYRHEDQFLRGKQLLTNYLYAHPKSTMGFIPTGANVNLINHSDKPNSKMQWSKHPMHAEEYLQTPPVELMNYQSIGVVMEIVALRDIEEGEEITINYGNSWQKAWDTHTKEFAEKLVTKQIDGAWPLRASDLNAKLATEALRTEDEQEDDPYPDDVSVKVFAMTDESGLLSDGTEEYPYSFAEPDDRTKYLERFLVEPDILEREEVQGKFTYTIGYQDDESEEYTYLTDVPQHAFVFVDDAASGDQFIPEPFRHLIEIPDDVFPQGPWRNLA